MKSSASVKSHPIHPILVSFPISFLTAAWLCDGADILLNRNTFVVFSEYAQIAGIVTGLLAAIPGLIDFSRTIPPKSSAKKRGVKHGLLNTAVIAISAFAWFLRNGGQPLGEVFIVESLAIILLFIAGWLGGTLVYRNQIGVDIRYANAGKWSEEQRSIVAGRVEVSGLEKLGEGQMKLIHADGRRFVLAFTEGRYVAFDDRCPHRGGSLAGGALICGTVQCPWHGSQFRVESGGLVAGPATVGITSYPVRRDGTVYYIDLSNH